MQIIDNIDEWIKIRTAMNSHLSIGFAPTMGNLHQGHASLYQRSKRENDLTIASLFINPKQFNRADDFNNYPRTLDNDLKFLEELGVDYCLLPQPEAIYFDDYKYQVQENVNSETMEEKFRPGHFTGVLTVVLKFFNLVRPTRAYFGEKDYQQYSLIKGMTKAFFLSIDVIACPTIREESSLAFSSRNNRLTSEAKKKAEQFATIFHQSEKSIPTILAELQAQNIEVEYMEEQENRRFAAVFIDSIRLIDNYAI